MVINPSLQWLLAVSMIGYLIAMYCISVLAQRRVGDAEDFLVAGRRLPFSLAWMTLLATWFGAGTMLTAADEVREGGLQRAALDPFGAGFCLILAGLFVAGPMWRMKLLTVPDFFARKFGSSSEILSSLILVPSYFGWIAAQFTALAEVLELFFDIPVAWGIVIVAIIGTGYTLMGGMLSVTMTDAVQIVLVLLGLIVLMLVILFELGNGSGWSGVVRLWNETPAEMKAPFPVADRNMLLGWIGVFAIGAFGNLPGQDLMQRIFAAKSAKVAAAACVFAGFMYLVFGMIPLLLALSGNLLIPESPAFKIVPALAQAFLHPAVAVIFLLAILSAILSTIDSAILSPSSVIAQNLLPKVGIPNSLTTNRYSVLAVAVLSLLLAEIGESAYALLEEAYLLTMVGLFIPLTFGLYFRCKSSIAANVSMMVGTGLWAGHFVFQWEEFLPNVPLIGPIHLPLSLGATTASALTYLGCLAFFRDRNQPESPESGTA